MLINVYGLISKRRYILSMIWNAYLETDRLGKRVDDMLIYGKIFETPSDRLY